eukprot:909096_1
MNPLQPQESSTVNGRLYPQLEMSTGQHFIPPLSAAPLPSAPWSKMSPSSLSVPTLIGSSVPSHSSQTHHNTWARSSRAYSQPLASGITPQRNVRNTGKVTALDKPSLPPGCWSDWCDPPKLDKSKSSPSSAMNGILGGVSLRSSPLNVGKWNVLSSSAKFRPPIKFSFGQSERDYVPGVRPVSVQVSDPGSSQTGLLYVTRNNRHVLHVFADSSFRTVRTKVELLQLKLRGETNAVGIRLPRVPIRGHFTLTRQARTLILSDFTRVKARLQTGKFSEVALSIGGSLDVVETTRHLCGTAGKIPKRRKSIDIEMDSQFDTSVQSSPPVLSVKMEADSSQKSDVPKESDMPKESGVPKESRVPTGSDVQALLDFIREQIKDLKDFASTCKFLGFFPRKLRRISSSVALQSAARSQERALQYTQRRAFEFRARRRARSLPHVVLNKVVAEEIAEPKNESDMYSPFDLYRVLSNTSVVNADKLKNTYNRKKLERTRDDSVFVQSLLRLRKRTFTSARIRALIPHFDAKTNRMFREANVMDQDGSEVVVAMTLHLFQTGFSVNNRHSNFQRYGKSSAEFLSFIDSGVLPPGSEEFLGDDPFYYDGCVVAELRDYRFMVEEDRRPIIRRVLLQSPPETMLVEVSEMLEEERPSKRQKLEESFGHNSSESDDIDLLRLESTLLQSTRSICIERTPRAMQVANISSFNKNYPFIRPLSTPEITTRLKVNLDSRNTMSSTGHNSAQQTMDWGFKITTMPQTSPVAGLKNRSDIVESKPTVKILKCAYSPFSPKGLNVPDSDNIILPIKIGSPLNSCVIKNDLDSDVQMETDGPILGDEPKNIKSQRKVDDKLEKCHLSEHLQRDSLLPEILKQSEAESKETENDLTSIPRRLKLLRAGEFAVEMAPHAAKHAQSILISDPVVRATVTNERELSARECHPSNRKTARIRIKPMPTATRPTNHNVDYNMNLRTLIRAPQLKPIVHRNARLNELHQLIVFPKEGGGACATVAEGGVKYWGDMQVATPESGRKYTPSFLIGSEEATLRFIKQYCDLLRSDGATCVPSTPPLWCHVVEEDRHLIRCTPEMLAAGKVRRRDRLEPSAVVELNGIPVTQQSNSTRSSPNAAGPRPLRPSLTTGSEIRPRPQSEPVARPVSPVIISIPPDMMASLMAEGREENTAGKEDFQNFSISNSDVAVSSTRRRKTRSKHTRY